MVVKKKELKKREKKEKYKRKTSGGNTVIRKYRYVGCSPFVEFFNLRLFEKKIEKRETKKHFCDPFP